MQLYCNRCPMQGWKANKRWWRHQFFLSKNGCPHTLNAATILKLFTKTTHKKYKQQKTHRVHVKRSNRDKSSESGGQASGGSQLDWCTTVAACIIQSSPLLSFPFLQPCKQAQTQHMETRMEGRRRRRGERLRKGDVYGNEDGGEKWDATGRRSDGKRGNRGGQNRYQR